MRALLLAVCLATLIAVPAVAAEPPQPGGGCQVQEEYVTKAHTSGSLLDGDFSVEPGARRPVECYS